MERSKTYKDRKKLNLAVKREFQSWLLKQVLLAVVLSAVVAALVLYFYARQEVVGSFFDAHVKLRRVSDLLLPVVFAGSLVSLIGGALLALFLPQKVAGPLYRIETDLAKVSEGNLATRIKLRDNDTLQDFAGHVDETVLALRRQVVELRRRHEVLESALSSNQLEKAREAAAALKESLDHFKV
ncbi:methyl-accepting chemotaxis protein [Desulfuromonas acetexigens]|uniref:Methyl-accepting chemotaxis protein n=1 Tax=Trichloromonas acetexigens TaxID=38815 RepID=A0A550JGI0_9BACT|nr:methyl-accepting chemotaxis protein [Desulfuromonas acetexigens]TRO82318.1 methyl-accepting chemotaxis protein [Desulfuromonas acetexigens]